MFRISILLHRYSRLFAARRLTFSKPSHIIWIQTKRPFSLLLNKRNDALEVVIMATKSILKSVNIRNRAAANALANAIEHAKERKNAPVKMSRPVSDATEDEIKEMFGDKLDDRI